MQKDSRYSDEEKISYAKFAFKLFRIHGKDIDPKIQEAFSMQWVSIAEVIENNQIAAAREMGEFKGKIEGKLEEKLDTAKKMLEANKPIDEIMKFTGLTKEHIQSLK
jgi:predicted transposase/invertase (TIGR01784 family)